MPKPHTPIAERLWAKVEKSGECWLWTGPTTNGYGVIGEGPRGGRTVRAHRLAYQLMVGPIPDGMQIDHLCRVRNCVNPLHLEPVTQAENLRRAGERRTHCPSGHELPPYRGPGRRRGECRACRRARYHRKKATA